MGPNLTDRVAVVTGASRGIGASVARSFAEAGAAVALAGRDEAALAGVAAQIRDEGGTALVVPTDVSDQAAVASLVETVLTRFGRLDCACNNAAGGGHRPTPLADVPVEAFDSGLTVTLRGVFLAMKYEIPAMLANGGGAIVNTSSTAGLQAVGGLAAYVSAKHGIEGLTKVAALDYAARGIRVTRSPRARSLRTTWPAPERALRERLRRPCPCNAFGQPGEVAAVVVWLCSEEASYVTGATVVIDGGKLAGTPPFQVQLSPAT